MKRKGKSKKLSAHDMLCLHEVEKALSIARLALQEAVAWMDDIQDRGAHKRAAEMMDSVL